MSLRRRRRRVLGLTVGFLAGTLGGYAAGLVRPPRSGDAVSVPRPPEGDGLMERTG